MQKYQIVESVGDNLTGDIVLTNSQRQIAGRVQNLQLAYEQKQAEFADAIRELKQAEEGLKQVKEQLYAAMQEAGIKTIESDILRMTMVAPTQARTVDTKAIQAREPLLWKRIEDNYLKITNRKGYVKITDKRNQAPLAIAG